MSQSEKLSKLPNGDNIGKWELNYNDAVFLRFLLDDFIEHIGERRIFTDSSAEEQMLERANSSRNAVTEYLNAAFEEMKD
jgi:hypothetical protein